MLSIGEFSRVSELSIKTLRFYHELGILVPEQIDRESGYRYYGPHALESAQRVKLLKELGFSLQEIKTILSTCQDEEELQVYLRKKLAEVNKKLSEYQAIKERLISYQPAKSTMHETGHFEIVAREVPDKPICSLSYTGQYGEIGRYFQLLFAKAARYLSGPPFALYGELEYKEEGAQIEACIEVKQQVEIEGLTCRLLKGGRAVSLLHRGPYGTQGTSYQRLFEYCKVHGLTIVPPLREIYLKGPGRIFRGNPQRYLTELILFY